MGAVPRCFKEIIMLSDIELEAMCWKVDAELKKHAANRNPEWWGIYHLWDSPNGDSIGEEDWNKVFRSRPFYMASAYMLWVNNGYDIREVCRTYNEGGFPALDSLLDEYIDDDDGTGCYYTEVVCGRCGAGWTCGCDCR